MKCLFLLLSFETQRVCLTLGQTGNCGLHLEPTSLAASNRHSLLSAHIVPRCKCAAVFLDVYRDQLPPASSLTLSLNMLITNEWLNIRKGRFYLNVPKVKTSTCCASLAVVVFKRSDIHESSCAVVCGTISLFTPVFCMCVRASVLLSALHSSHLLLQFNGLLLLSLCSCGTP